MEKQDTAIGKYVHRHMSQLRILSRLLEHELDASKTGKEVVLDRDLAENVLDTLEIFIEDFDTQNHGGEGRSQRAKAEAKPTVTRLN